MSNPTPWSYLVVGIAMDVRDGIVHVWPMFLLSTLIVGLIIRTRPQINVNKAFVFVLTAAISFPILLFAWAGASEFRIERGLYPTFWDFKLAFTDLSYVTSSVHFLGMDRFRNRVVFGIFLGVLSIFLAWKAHRKSNGLLIALGVGGTWYGADAVYINSSKLFHDIATREIIKSPFEVFHVDLGLRHDNVRVGARGVLAGLQLPQILPEEGSHFLGLKYQPALSQSNCEQHPLLESFESIENEKNLFRHLSTFLIQDLDAPRIWILSLEGFRAGDMHALYPNAPIEITPFMNSLYEDAKSKSAHVIAFRNAFQSGVRTSQAMAALLCGLGTAPFSLSLARDVGLLPFRCISDVLRDAGFEAGFYYGSNPGFDNMLEFLTYHGFNHWMTEKDYVESAKRIGWGVPDRMVLSQTVRAASGRKGPQLNYVMSVTNHHPFQRPGDFPIELANRIKPVLAQAVRPLSTEMVTALETLAYSDLAFSDFIQELESHPAVASQSIVIINGDHSLNDPFAWHLTASEALQRASAHIPLLIYFPEALIQRSSSPEKIRELISSVNQEFAQRPISQNDVPRMILALLSQHTSLRNLEPAWKWHTLGGQSQSLSFHSPFEKKGIVFGINSESLLFHVNEQSSFYVTDERSEPLTSPEQAVLLNKTLQPITAFLSHFMNGYGSACWEEKNIRRSVP